MPAQTLHERLLVSGSVVALVAGVSLPWLTLGPNTSTAPVPPSALTGTNAGVGIFDGILLGIAVFGVLLRRCSRRKWLASAVTLLTGAGVAGFPVLYLSATGFAGLSGPFVPASGWYLTVVAGVTLALTGTAGLVGPRRLRALAPVAG